MRQIPSNTIVSPYKLHHTNSNITSIRIGKNVAKRKKEFLDILPDSPTADLIFHNKKIVAKASNK